MSKSGESPRPDWGEREKVVLTNIEGEGSYLYMLCINPEPELAEMSPPD